MPMPSPDSERHFARRLMDKQSSFVMILVCLGLLLPSIGFTQQAGTAQDPCAEGLQLAAREQNVEARELLLKCLEGGDESLMPLVAMTMMALEDDQVAEALDWSLRAITAHPDSAESRFWHGLALEASGDLEGAKKSWELALQRDTEHGPTLRRLAMRMLDEGDERAANGLLIQLVRVEGGDAWSLRTLSDLARKRALWRQALAHWDAALQIGPTSGADLRRAGELAILAGDTTYAVAVCREAIAVEPVSASWLTLGEALFASRRFEEAVPAFQKALEMDAGAFRVRFHLANALELLGRIDEAGEAFRSYIMLVPEDPLGFMNYSVHLDKQGRTAEALVQAQQAGILNRGGIGPLLLQAQILEKLDQDEDLLVVLDDMVARGLGDYREILAWRERVQGRLDLADSRAGQMRLLHIATPDSTALRLIQEDLLDGLDFATLATRYSVASTAAQGGDIGWVDPESMIEEMRRAIHRLQIHETTPPIHSGGLYHFFKRIR